MCWMRATLCWPLGLSLLLLTPKKPEILMECCEIKDKAVKYYLDIKKKKKIIQDVILMKKPRNDIDTYDILRYLRRYRNQEKA